MAVDINLNIDTVKGESVRDGHKDEIDVLSWHWGMTQSGSTHIATGSGSGKVDVHDITFTKRVDKSSPVLIHHCCNGVHFDKAKLTVMKAGGKQSIDYLVIEMENLIISSYSTGGGAGSDDLIMETVGLNFGKFKLHYQPQGADGGKLGGTIDTGWDIAVNKDW